MKLSQLDALVAVAKVHSINGAAKAIGISQPALTKTIHALEEEIGAALLHRSTSGVSLTAYGDLVIKRARGVQKEIDRLRDEVSTLKHQMGGRLSIGVTPLATAVGIGAAVGRTRKKYPSIECEFAEMRSLQIMDGLTQGVLDLGLLTLNDEVDVAGFECHLLASFPSILLGGGNRSKGITPVGDLMKEEWVDFEPSRQSTNYIETLASNARLSPPAVIHRSTSLHLGIELAAELGAVCYVSEMSAPYLEQIAGAAKLTRIKTDFPLPELNVVLAYPREEFLTPAAREFVRSLRGNRLEISRIQR